MVDSKEIEELRALAFASIPTIARKAQFLTGNSTLRGKRKRTALDTEEGEILSDEDAAAAALATSMATSASKSHLDRASSGSFREVVLDASTKQRGIVPASLEVAASVSTESPSIVAIVPSHIHMEENQDFDSHRPSMVLAANDENATFKLESMAKSEEVKSSQYNAKVIHAPRTSKSAAGSLPSKIPTAPLPAGGIRKEADAFLASLNIPATASPSHLSGFAGDRNNSLVIKFSDDDSDSDGEQDEQFAADRSNNKTWIANEPPLSSTRMGLSSQSTSGLKSEIDRVKKQIAAIERAKGMGGVLQVSRLSKSTTMEVPRQSNLKASVTSRTVPVDLESLRQQIARKENDLKRRKQKGLKEPLNNGNVSASSWSIDAMDLTQASDARFLSLEKSESEAGGADVFVEDAPTTFVNEASNMNGASFKMEGAVSFGPNCEPVSTLCHQVPDMAITSDTLSMAPAVQNSTVSLDTQLLDPPKESTIIEALSSENKKPALEGCDQTLATGKIIDMSRNKTNTTPKRKRHEFDQAGKFSLLALRSESAKKQKRKGFSVSAESLMLNGSKEAGIDPAILSASSLYKSHVSISKVSDGENHASQLSEVKENTISVQGMPKALSLMSESKQDIGLQTGRACLMLDVSDRTDVAVPTCVEKASSHSAYTVTKPSADCIGENAVSETAVLLQLDTSEVPPGVKESSAKIAEAISQQDGIVQADDTLKHVGTSIDVSLSPLSSPSRDVVERQGDSSVFPREQKMLRGILVEASSAGSSIPIWAYNSLHNPNMALLQGVGDQRLEYGNDALWKLQEEEDVIDKELEEAQQSRRRCEVREHFARKQYRDAQEALHSANLRCEMLFQRREMLSASVKAAQLHVYSNKSSLVSQRGEGALVSLGSPTDPFRIKTSFWTREKGETGKLALNHLSDQDHNGFDPDFTSFSKQSKGLSRFQLDGSFVSEKTQLAARVSGLEEPVAFDSSASKLMAGQPDNTGVIVRERDSTVEKVVESIDTASFSTLPKSANSVCTLSQEPSSQCLSAQECSIGPVVREIILDSSNLAINAAFQSGNGEGKHLAEAVHGKSVEKGSHHGFSSASFATDLERDANQNSHDNEKSNTNIKGQKATAKQCSFSFQPLSLHCAQATLNKEQASNKSSDESLFGSLRISPMIENDIGICGLKDLASHSFCERVTDCETQHESESLLGEKAHPSSQQQLLLNGRRLDLTTKQTFTNPSSVDTCLDKQAYSRSSDDSSNKLWSVEGTAMDLDEVPEGCKGTSFDKEKINKDPSVLQLGRPLVMQELQSSGVPASDLCRKAENGSQPVRVSEAEQEIGPMVDKVPATSDSDFKLEEDSASSICFVPSTSLNLLMSHALHPHMMGTWKQQIVSGVSDESIQSVSGNYESPLCSFHSYRGMLQPGSSTSYCQPHAIDPHKVLCMFEHRGKCNNDECIWQHKRDYMVGLSPNSKQLHGIADVSEFQEVIAVKERKGLNSTGERTDGSIPTSQKCMKWNVQAPVYRIGSYLRKTQCSESLFSCMLFKGQLGFGQPFLALHRQVPMDMPCLLDSSLKLQTLNDDSVLSRQLRMEDRLWIEDEGQHSGTLEDAESLLEAALELFDYDLKVQKSEVRKSVLYVLSRGLEANPGSVATWVVYLHLFYRWEKSLSKDDLFVNAVQHNKGSYELWMMFINSRRHLMDRLKAYDSAIVALGSKVELQGHPLESKSSFLLDLALQKLNYMCTSDLCQEAASWINNLAAVASEDVESFGRHEASSIVLLTCLARSELCILWICCAYVMLQNQLPINVIECLGCKQHLFFQNIWVDSKKRSSCNSQVMKIMRTGASQGKGCMKLDVNEPTEKSFQIAKEVFAANLVQCAAVCEGLECSFTIVKKYFKLFSPSVELTLLRAQLEEHQKGKAASLHIFEEALTRWPLHQSGKMRLWNQYIGCAFEAEGTDFVKVLLARCADEICDSDSSRSVSKSLGTFTPTILNTTKPSKCAQQQNSQTAKEVSKASIQSAFQLLPLIVKRQQLMKGSGCSGQLFSYQDAVFGYVNLAFLEVLNKDGNSARNALQSSLNVAADADSMRHCLKEIAVFTSGVSDSSTVLSPSFCSQKLLGLLDRCIVETQLLGAVHSLSRGFCESIKKRQVCQFVGSLLGPSPTDSTFLNSILESIHGPTLLPKETLAWRDLLDYTEKILEILPSNVRLATSLCRVVQSRVADIESSTGASALFWCTSLLIDSLCQTSTKAPEPTWVEAGGFVRMLEVDSLLEDFYRLAISVHPFSSSLWHGFLTVSSKTGNFKSALESAKEKGVKLDSQFSSL